MINEMKEIIIKILRFIFWIVWVFLAASIILALGSDNNKDYYPPVLDYSIRVEAIGTDKTKETIELYDSRNNVKHYLLENVPNSPMIDYVDLVFDNLENEKAIKLFAIAGTESNFGTRGYIAINCNNYFGYLYGGTSRRGCYSTKWDTPEHAILRFIKLEEEGWLALDNDMQGYCVSNCEHWRANFDYFYNIFY